MMLNVDSVGGNSGLLSHFVTKFSVSFHVFTFCNACRGNPLEVVIEEEFEDALIPYYFAKNAEYTRNWRICSGTDWLNLLLKIILTKLRALLHSC
jgi:hypothetical protein